MTTRYRMLIQKTEFTTRQTAWDLGGGCFFQQFQLGSDAWLSLYKTGCCSLMPNSMGEFNVLMISMEIPIRAQIAMEAPEPYSLYAHSLLYFPDLCSHIFVGNEFCSLSVSSFLFLLLSPSPVHLLLSFKYFIY